MFSQVSGYSLASCYPVIGAKGTRRGQLCSPLCPHPLPGRLVVGGQDATLPPSPCPGSGLGLSLIPPVSVQSLLCTIGLFTQ